MSSPQPHTPLILIVLDGWGYREDPQYNAIAAAHAPFWHHLWQNYPHTLVEASGGVVGLPADQMGNSEVGHLHMGAGRVVLQDLTRIDHAIETGEFANNPVLVQTIDALIKAQKPLHIFGLLSPGGVHSHESHIVAMIHCAAKRGLKQVYLHAFLDGRDTSPKSAHASLVKMQETFQALGCGAIASMVGRYYAMDRDKRWERTQKAYDLLTQGKADFNATSAILALDAAYARGETDEFVLPTAIHAEGASPITVQDGDGVVFINFRSDRARQLSHAFTDAHFDGFVRAKWPTLTSFVTMTDYGSTIQAEVAYPSIALKNIFGEYISQFGYKQLRIAETEKYAHVTFFFNGGEEKLYPGEDRILVPSPKVATYDLQPEMSAESLTDQLIEAIKSQQYQMIVCNFANPDMVGHTGNFKATIQAIEVIDRCLNRIIDALKTVGGEAVITADHGNAEFMFDPSTGQAHTAHTTNVVPVIYVGRPATFVAAKGVLYDIAPTLLHLLNLAPPAEMTGETLFQVDA